MRRTGLLVAALLCLPPVAPARASEGWTPRRALEVAAAAAGVPLTPARPLPFDIAASVLGIEPSDLARLRTAIGAPAARAGVEAILRAVGTAEVLHRRAWAGVSPELRRAAWREPERAASLLTALDRGMLLSAQLLLVETVERAAPALRQLRLDAVFCTARQVVCIGTDAADVWADDVQVLIDPAGDDLYVNNAGGTLAATVVAVTGGCVLGGGSTNRGRPNLDCSPAPSVVCTYDTANRATGRRDLPVLGLPGHDDPDGPDGGDGTDGSCGNDQRRARTLDALADTPDDPDGRATTLLLDLDGADTYTAPWAHEDPLFGLIADCFPGDEQAVNTNRDFIQGGSLAGLALAWDAGSGDDVFRGRLNTQGSGHLGGVGMLVVEGTGDTTFWADRLSQGNGIAAGVGLVVNRASGAQQYLLDPPQVYRNEFAPSGRDCQAEGRAGQGQGGFGGVGILVTDGGSTSRYRAVTHLVENVHPYRPVLDTSGRPRLVRGTDAQGSGESFPIIATSGGVVAGVGVLVDRTDGDARTCSTHPRAGMIAGATTSAGLDLSTIGVMDPACGKFNLPAEFDPVADPVTAMQRLSAGAVGIRLVRSR